MNHTYSSALSGDGEEGRSRAIADVYQSLSPECQRYVDLLCDTVVHHIKLCSSLKGVTIPFSREMALQLIWEMEIFRGDPHGIYKNKVFQRYMEYLNK